MALELRQQLKLTQKLVMTPQLRLAIKLLQLNRLDLSQALQAELEQNPALEIDHDGDGSHQEIPADLSLQVEEPKEPAETEFTAPVAPGDDKLAEVDWEDYSNTFEPSFSFSRERPAEDAPSQFDFISEKPGLAAYLQWQLAHCGLDEQEWEIALFIIGNLNRFGFLDIDYEDIQVQTGCSPDEAEYALEVIQYLDPPGIGARTVVESLLLQLERLDMADSIAATIVRDHLDLLQTRNIKQITRLTGYKRGEVVTAINFITDQLTPYPGLPYVEETTAYIVPDVYVHNIDGELVISLNDEDLPQLKVSSYYQELLKAQDDSDIDQNSHHYLTDKVKSAHWFIKSIHQRQRTIFRVMESILKFQRGFFEHGPTALRPLILRDVAADIGMHESTISRVTSNKYVQTPQGIFELKYFFSTAIERVGGDALAAESIKARIKKMIQDEDQATPLSDGAIVERLSADNIKIARRTVAKYREQMRIPPVKHRRSPSRGRP
jgi:RNA polymerase sigma-54 factor